MRLLLDAHLSGRRIGRLLRAAGHDVRALDEDADLAALPDEEVLPLATQNDRILVTADVSDFVPILQEWAASGREHRGVILVYVAQYEFALIARGIERLIAERPAQEDWLNFPGVLDRST